MYSFSYLKPVCCWDQLEGVKKKKRERGRKETGFLTIMDQKQPTVSNQMHKGEWKANGISEKDAEGRMQGLKKRATSSAF